MPENANQQPELGCNNWTADQASLEIFWRHEGRPTLLCTASPDKSGDGSSLREAGQQLGEDWQSSMTLHGPKQNSSKSVRYGLQAWNLNSQWDR